MEMGLDAPDIPIGIASDFHLKKCELRRLPHLSSRFCTLVSYLWRGDGIIVCSR